MTRSQALFDRAVTCIPGGVNSPVRAFGGVGGTPRFAQRAHGAYIYDADGQRYIDYVGSYGPMLLGHAHPGVIEAVRSRLGDGLSFGAPTEIEVEMAQTLCRLVPSMDQVRMVNSGTEATMSAIRLARGFTGRDKIIKFEGCYHGHGDALLVKAGSGALTLGEPNSPGVPADCVRHTLSATYNDLDSVVSALQQARGDVAAVIVEPVAGNMNCVLPAPGFLSGLRKLCDEAGAVLIFDEVMTGFRVALGGAQALYGVTPDITTLGKVIGGGMPVGALGGRADIMRQLTPQGPVYQAGTLSGNPIAMAAGLATIEALQAPGFYQALESKTEALTRGLRSRAAQAGVGLVTNYAGAMFGLFLTDQPSITGYGDVMNLDRQRFARFFHGMLDSGIWFAPAAFEAAFMSAAHSEEDIQQTLAAASHVLTALGSVSA